jgi:hypothetical protein
MSIRSYQDSSRIFAAQSVNAGSTVATSTAVFGTHQVRISAIQPIKYIVGPAPSVSSTVILQTGTLLPANVVEYVSTAPGEQLAAISFGVTSSIVGVAETCA